MPVPPPNANIARHLSAMAAARSAQAAVKIPRGRTRGGDIDYLSLSFAELDAEVAAWSHRLIRAGVKAGDRTLVMVRQGLPLIASVFATLRIGAVPVVIDPGMPRKTFLACVAKSEPSAMLGTPLAQLVSRFFRTAFHSVRTRVTASSSLTARLSRADSRREQPAAAAPAANSASSDLAAILFTSGSTGAPKGVCYEHGMFEAQIEAVRDTYGIEPGEIDLPLLPIFALFNPALGMTTIVPEFDPRRPAALNAANIVRAIRQENVSNSFGSPTLWGKIAAHCAAERIALPSLRRVLCAGAAVPTSLWTASRALLPNGKLHSPYGATEALPVASIAAHEIEPGSIRGACVGRPVRRVDVKIIGITDEPIADLEAAHEVEGDEVGEIIVRGSVVTKMYHHDLAATKAAKIGPGELWHRMGDCGYLDAAGKLWFSGRKAERVETLVGTLHTEPCEQVFRQHARAARCALIGLGERGRQRPAIVAETKVSNSAEGRALARELRLLALKFEHTATIKLFYFREHFPVDVRHNAKIHRLTLARWAATVRGYESDPKR